MSPKYEKQTTRFSPTDFVVLFVCFSNSTDLNDLNDLNDFRNTPPRIRSDVSFTRLFDYDVRVKLTRESSFYNEISQAVSIFPSIIIIITEPHR